MKERSRYLIKNTSIFAIGEMGTKLINFILVPFYTYVLTTAEYGTVDLIFTLCTIIIPLVMFNIGEAIMRYAMDVDADYEKILSAAIVTIVSGVFLASVVIFIASIYRSIAEYKFLIYFYVVMSATKSVVTSYLRGREKLKQYVGCNLLNTFLIAMFNIVFLSVLDMGIAGYMLAYVLAELVAIIYAIVVGKIYKDISRFSWDWNLIKKMIWFSLAVVPNSLLWWVINSSDRVMVTAMYDVSENGLLAVGYKIPSLLTMINTILMQAWKYSAIRERESEDRDQYANEMLRKFLVFSALVSVGIIIVIRPATYLLFEESYYLSWKSSIYLLAGFVFMGVGTFVGTIYYVEKNMVGNMLSALIGAIVNIVLNFVFIPSMGAAGATLAAMVSYFVIMTYRYIDTKKYQKLNVFCKKNILIYLMLLFSLVGAMMDNEIGIVISIFAMLVMVITNYKLIKDVVMAFFHTVLSRRNNA